MIRILSIVMAFLRIVIVVLMLVFLQQFEIFYVIDEYTKGFLSVFVLFVLLFFMQKIPLEKLFKIRFDSIDKAITYELCGYRLKKKIKINDQCYVVIYGIRRTYTSFILFQKRNGFWEKRNTTSFILYKDLKIYCKKISNEDLLIFAYYLSSTEGEHNSYHIKDYLGHNFMEGSMEVMDSSQKKNLIYFYTVLKLNDRVYELVINDENVKLK